MKHIYGRDHIGIDLQMQGNRIKLITHLLTQMQKSAIDQNVAAEATKPPAETGNANFIDFR
jgi:hypothetical protein